jgi:hypothetical protein
MRPVVCPVMYDELRGDVARHERGGSLAEANPGWLLRQWRNGAPEVGSRRLRRLVVLCVLAAGRNVGEHLIDLRPGLVRFVKEREPPRGVRRILFGSTLLLCFTVAVEHQADAHDEIPARERQPCAAVALPADGIVPARTDVGRDEETGAGR